MKNEHLVPPIVLDIGEKINSNTVRENEKMNYLLRIEAIREYCDNTISKFKNTKQLVKPNSRAIR